jgi:AAA domain/FaeA-like protein
MKTTSPGLESIVTEAHLGQQAAQSGHVAEVVNFPTVPQDAPQAARPQTRLRALTRGELRTLPRHTWLIGSWLPAASLVCMFGLPGSGKSFAALDMACCIQEALNFHGHQVENGHAVYVWNEGTSGANARITAWENVNGRPANITTVTGVPQMANQADTAWLASTCAGAALVVIDTQARSTVGLEENSAKEMGPVIAAYGALIERGATVLVVHHGDGKLRGSTSMWGAADACIAVEKSGASVTLSMRDSKGGKVKDGEAPPDLILTLTPDPVQAQDGSSSVALTATPDALTGREAAVLAEVCVSIDDNLMPGCPISTADVAAHARITTPQAKWALNQLRHRFLVSKSSDGKGSAAMWTASEEGKRLFLLSGGVLPELPVAIIQAKVALLQRLDGNEDQDEVADEDQDEDEEAG